jgi:hypothetical protein
MKVHSDKTLKAIEMAFGINNVSVLSRIREPGILHKKPCHIINETKTRSFQKSQKFLSEKQINDLVFVDATGTNHQDIKEDACKEKGAKVIQARCGGVCQVVC